MKTKAEPTVENLENRDTARIDHTSSLQVKDLQSGKIHKAKMINYSKEGFYFESDSVLNPGMQIYIGIENSPYASSPDVLEYHRAQIRACRFISVLKIHHTPHRLMFWNITEHK
jgi:hypothetical protein